MEKELYSVIGVRDITNIILGYCYNPIDDNVIREINQSYRPIEYLCYCGDYYYMCNCFYFWHKQLDLRRERLFLHNLNN